MADGTLDRIYWPLMRSPSVRLDHCAICGRPAPLNQHHMVFRSAGDLVVRGVRMPKPTITLCGHGNHLRDAEGRYYCHGLAHALMLHFRWVRDERSGSYAYESPGMRTGGGHLEYLRTDAPTSYGEALREGGWKKVRTR